MAECIQSGCKDGMKANETGFVKLGNKKHAFKINMKDYNRQNSENEVKENNLSPSSEPCKFSYISEKNLLSRQQSNCPFVEKVSSTSVTLNDYDSNDTMFTEISKKQNGEKHNRSCCWTVQAFTVLISLMALGLVLFLYYKVTNSEVQLPEVIIGHSNHEPIFENIDSISGSFKLDQQYLSDYKDIRWTADEQSTIIPSRDTPCLMVPDDGKYLVFSRFTFRIPAGDDKTVLTHQLTLKSKTESGDIKETVFKRQYVSVIEHKLKEDSELRKPSVFIQFFELQAGDEICTGVSNPDLLYISSIDNDVNIIKV
ncbi:uncharacterized protein LOC123555085 [Mercenaria mercenaria]|uniref:uncharacterized protein LOC123555085 n=1 Tax=Mercenaria mercenaria TaxID=6596 RepID=UPI00234F491C|nr:uncharacterized protein LOC123555085 [Mercenaria mercenaria]